LVGEGHGVKSDAGAGRTPIQLVLAKLAGQANRHL